MWLCHVTAMINISEKGVVRRFARASGRIRLRPETIDLIRNHRIKKGDVVEAAKIAGITGAKEAWMRMPYCHQIPLESVDFSLELEEDGARVTCSVLANWKTGVEMDALSCVSSALLTVWDMVKYVEKDETGNYPHTRIHDMIVEEKEKSAARP